MKRKIASIRTLLLLSIAIAAPGVATADEGMWPFNNPPREALKTKHNFDATNAWLDHLMHSAVRFNSGGSASFVSADGLVMTNHHVGSGALQKLSTREHDFIATGFYAKTREQEAKCPDLELNVLINMEDVTQRVSAAVKPGMNAADAQVARRAIMNTIEQESLKATGLRSDVVTLYQGGQYQLYRYKKYTDVRLVFAPEKDIAFFGGDPDNFEYPRYDLDICFFRAYENDRPATIEHYLKWSKSGAKDGDLVFVAGNPGHTDRLNTLAHLEFLRDHSMPDSLNGIRRSEVLLRTYSERSVENARRAQAELFGVENGRKAMLGRLAALQDPAVMLRKKQDEATLRTSAGEQAGRAWDDIAAALKVSQQIHLDMQLWEGAGAFRTKLFGIARELVRLADETPKPNADRLREYRESNMDSLKQQLFSPAPIYNDLETAKLADSLSFMVEKKGGGDPVVLEVLEGKSPVDRAAELIAGTKLADVALRHKLFDGGRAAIEASDDPMIRQARQIDQRARAVRKIAEQQVEEPMRQAYARIADARFKALGTGTYPDATFTLRLAFGTVRGYGEGSEQIPPFTTIAGAYQHAADHANLPPFRLPHSWVAARDKLDPNVPFNFISTADIIGGNSGSPVVNRAGDLVGIIFDGNIDSLGLDFVYTDQKARAVSVHSAAIIEALRKVYNAAPLADELQPDRG
ncbi:MAG: Peptidase [Phycisphaerales bacterium]|nr:Peptidase [Phycisphaerales bacterium]